MRNCFTLFVVIILLFAISGCSTETEKSFSETETEIMTIQSTEPPSLIYDSIDYWDIVHDEIVAVAYK